MKTPHIPDDEVERQRALEETGLLNGSAEERFDRITRLARQAFSVPVALVSLIDHDRQWFKSSQGLDARETPRDISFCGHAILSSTPLIVENALKDIHFADNPLVTGAPKVRFYAGAPLHTVSGHRIGTLCLIDTQPRTFNGEQIEMLRDLAATVEELIQTDTVNHKSRLGLESALGDSEWRARLVIEGTGVGIWQWNVQTGETVFNERWAEIAGYTLEELSPVSIDTWMGLAHPDDLAESEALLTAHFSGVAKNYDYKTRMRHKQGHWVWVHDRGQVFEWTPEGEPLLMYGTHADITREVEAQLALKASRDEFASLVSNMPGVSYRSLPDENRTMLYISGQVGHVSGYAAEELIGNKTVNYAQLRHPDDAPGLNEAIANAMVSDKGWHYEYRIRHRDGSWRWVEERGKWVTGNEQYPRLLEGFIVDITREHEARAQLSKHHEALVLLNDIAFNPNNTLDAKIQYALEKARHYLGTDMAILSHIESSTYTARWVDGTPEADVYPGQCFSLGQTWCQLLFSGKSTELFVADAKNSEFQTHPCYQALPLGSYAGIIIEVEGQAFGTLNFSAADARAVDFDESDTLFVRLLAHWLSDILENSLSSERLNKLMAQLPGVTYQFRRFPDGHSTFPFSSPQIEVLYGLTPAQAARDASLASERIHPDDLDELTASIAHSATTLETWYTKYRVRNEHGTYRWVAGQARPEPLSDGSILWHGYLNDIHDQEEGRQALERNESRLRSLFEFSPIGIALNDFKTGQFIDLNDALLQPSGYTREEFVQLSYWTLTPKEYQAEEEKALSSLESIGRYGPYEKENIRKDGSRYPVRLQGMLSQDSNGCSVIWSLIEDITERRQLDLMKDQFIATVSHELRTPLTSINGSLGLLAGGAVGALPEKANALVETAQRNAKHLAVLISDLLDMEKLVAGKMPMKMVDQALGPLIEEAVESLAGYATQHKVRLQTAVNEPAVQLHVDGSRLIQALTNLISNAIKFSPVGDAVEISTELDGNLVTIRVRDHGPGVDPAFRSQLFKRFSQADGSDTRKLPGTGLGLAITREISQQLGGEVDYQDAPQGGGEFYIQLPVAGQ